MALQSLRAIAETLRPLGRHAVFYLAAAVSDFYIPWPQMVSPITCATISDMQNLSFPTVLMHQAGMRAFCLVATPVTGGAQDPVR